MKAKNNLLESTCPFFNGQIEFTQDLKKSYVKADHYKLFIDRMSIEEMIEGIVDASGIKADENVIKGCVKIFNDNWVFDWQQLKSFMPEKIKFLNLPLFLETKIVEALEFYRASAFESEQKKARDIVKTGTLVSAAKFSENQGSLVTASWGFVSQQQGTDSADMTHEITKLFYDRFFEVSPMGRALFENRSMEHQAATLFRIINYIVDNLEKINPMNTFIKRLGGRHALYGVTENDFIPFIEEFAKTLQTVLGEEMVDSATYEAWIAVMQYTARSMIEAGKTKEKGQRIFALVEDDDDNLVSGYLKITLDRLYICKDETYSSYIRQLTLRGMKKIELVKHKDSEFCFEITSKNPNFTLLVGGPSEREMKKILVHFAWRLKALNRVSSEGDVKEFTGDHISDVDKFVKELNSGVKDGEHSNESSNSILAVRDLSHTEILQKTWEKILEGKRSIEESASAQKFFETLFDRLIMLSPQAEKLFDSKTILTHIPALGRMIGLIIQERSDVLKEKLVRTGGKHFIWGVRERDFQSFATATCDALQQILGDAMTMEIRDVWFDTILNLGKTLLKHGKRLNSKSAFSMSDVHRKGSRNNSWVECSITLTLEDFHIYKDKMFKKLRTSSHLEEIHNVNKDNAIKGPTEFILAIRFSNKKTSYLSFVDYRDMKLFHSEIRWRLDALRTAKGKSSTRSMNTLDEDSQSASLSTKN